MKPTFCKSPFENRQDELLRAICLNNDFKKETTKAIKWEIILENLYDSCENTNEWVYKVTFQLSRWRFDITR